MSKNSKKADKETAPSIEPVAPPAKPTLADLGEQHSDAQQKFERATSQANLEAYKTLLGAYRDYATELYNAQNEFEGYAFEAYQNYLARLAQISGSEETSNAHYWEFVRLTTSLATEGGWRESVEKAYRELVNSFTATESQPDALVRQTAAYRAYVDQLTAAWKQAEPIQRQAEQAYMACAREQKDGATKAQTAFESAYQDYLNDLNQAYVRSNLEQRTATATSNYLTKAEESCKHSQTTYADAAKGLSETQENLVRSLQP